MAKKERLAICTLLGGFLIHAIIGVFHTRSKTYIYSYLSEISIKKFSKNYLDLLFSISNVIYNIFILIGVICKAYFNTVTITGIGLGVRVLCQSTLILLPDIRIVSIAILLSGASCGLVYLPILLDIWRYFPKTKGVSTAFVLSGFGITRLIFKYVITSLINPDGVSLKTGTYKYPKEINESYLIYLKQSQIFFACLSVLAVLLVYPYEIYVPLSIEKKKYEKKLEEKRRKKEKKHSLSYINLNRIKDTLEKNPDEVETQSYLKLVFKNTPKKIEANEERPVYEPLFSLVVSFPFLQLTSVFFFATIYGVIELSSLRRLGLLFGLREDFLWKTSLIWKIINVCFFSLWGYYLDKIGIKNILMIALTAEITNNALCYFIVRYKIGFIVFTVLSAAINSASLSLFPTCYALIFGDEKGILLYSISSILLNTFYICRPIINNLIDDKVYYLMYFLIVTVFSMFSIIILCFFVEKKHVYKDEIIQQKKESVFKRASELSDLDTNNDEENSYDNNSLFKGLDNKKEN